ncbi:Iterative polyketide synthase CazM 11 [Colletotrichum chlorophyti]|uniref:Iterative polyketide synthase CazM 11 n=1 Tax=Colletotrichum chlorophyti TaxID=708187 RepID=A0A1Q8RX61_9PEZI|nr:Iterative polyketide synthase CazM 11 [Colletotrichum chlorophyti]
MITVERLGQVDGKPWQDTDHPLPNTLLVPLVVAYQMTQYEAFINQVAIDWAEVAPADMEALGLCTGLLTAFAASSAGGSKELLAKYGAVAMRLGLLVGMVVDAQDSLEPARSLSVAWNSAESGREARRILESDEFRGTYVSVHFDETRATVTTSPTKISALQQRLRESSLITSEIGLVGPFHAKRNVDHFNALLAFVDKHPEFHFANTRDLAFRTRSNNDGSILAHTSLHHHALESILVHPPQWWRTFSVVRDARLQDDTGTNNYIVSFGSERCVPPSLMRSLRSQVIHLADHESALFKASSRRVADSDIAVVGMACKVAGADGLEEFWDLLCNGKPQHQELTGQRFSFQTPFRPADPKRKWFANLIDGADHFDHKFFKRSPRESATMDPQQRWMLQIAYQAVEQSGYFNAAKPERSVGCYIGLRGNDYYDNIACHPPNAFSATGNLQAFVAGKISHQFDWVGPAMTIDTACSSSLVAVHQACRAIISGDCNAALAGGAHIMTSPNWFQNLAGASFLSTTGQCKPFDAAADGYCRGDGVGAVFLKKLSQALADGDQVLGVIPATAVQQNLNCTPIFVPNSPSLSDLFQTVTTRAAIKPEQVTVVEAHGTGTAVGDPAEYGGIREVLGGRNRTSPLVLGSVKGLVGHTECASGIVSAVKILLMIQKGMIPPQASFKTINPAIGASPQDNIRIATSLEPWQADFRAALINNYGASGSNASMIITQPAGHREVDQPTATGKYPFWLSAADNAALVRYAAVLNTFLQHQASNKHASLSNISFNVARQSNRQLQKALVFTAKSVDELRQALTSFAAGNSSAIQAIDRPVPKPVVLCFGGQISTYVGLDKNVFDRSALLRKHLNDVDAKARSIGVGSIFPGIFERKPFTDTVALQVTLFAFQYACAKSWIESGIDPVAVVGHSFGELTALCISGALSLADTVKMIVGRATLIRDAWGTEKGAMMAIEADEKEVQLLLSESAKARPDVTPATIACHNGPRSFTLAGSAAAIDAVADTLLRRGSSSSRTKRLNVTNAFHCALVDPLMKRLEENAQGLNFREPAIPLERTSTLSTTSKMQQNYFAEHMRSPVYFYQALERLHKQYPSCIFLEAGSNSTVTSMAGRALGNPAGSHFQAINITCCDDGWDKLTDATVNLWKAGLTAHHWGHHAVHTPQHAPLLLPPYQFEESSHWFDLKTAAPTVEVIQEVVPEKAPERLINFIGYLKDGDKLQARFQINTAMAEYEKTLSGHLIAQTAPICPATVQTGFVLNALSDLKPELSNLVPQTHNVKFLSPICRDPQRALWIDATETTAMTWEWTIYSTTPDREDQKMLHTSGQLDYRSLQDQSLQTELSRYDRLFGHKRCVDILNSDNVDDVLGTRTIYMLFSDVVEYGEEFRGVTKLVGMGNQSAAQVVRKNTQNEWWYDAHLADTFCQLGGIWANCMAADRTPGEVFIANGIEQWVRSPRLLQKPRPDAFHVYATNSRTSDRATLTDVFIFDAADGSLCEVILGIGYSKCPKVSLQKLLSRLTAGGPQDAPPVGIQRSNSMPTPPTPLPIPAEPVSQHQEVVLEQPKPIKAKKPKQAPKQAPKVDVVPRIKAILADLSGLEMDEIKDDSQLADLGIDSLVGMEMAHEIEAAYKITLPEDELINIMDLPGLIACVQKALGTGGDTAVTPRTPKSDLDDDWEDAGLDERSVSDADLSTRPTSPEMIDEEFKGHGKATTGYSNTSVLTFDQVMGAFNETKSLTDGRIAEQGQTAYVDEALPLQTELTVALTLEAFEQSNQPLREVKPGQTLAFVPHKDEHRHLVRHLYRMLETETQTVIVNNNDTITRTAVPFTKIRSSESVYQELVTRFPDQNTANKLTKYAGAHLAEVLSGKTDGVRLIFGSAEGRELVSGFYADWPLNQALYKLMDDFFTKLITRLNISPETGPLKILEMGAGTGGTTKRLLPLLARLGVPIEYTFTDLAPSLVAAARKKWGKEYPFMKFRTHDIEKVPEDDLIGTQHIVLSSNAVHATRSLVVSTGNVRKVLRPDGLLLMLEMTRTPYWVDLVFGLFEGWWLFEDGRSHALTHEDRWRTDLQKAGYGHVDWTEGATAESEIEKLVIALADPSSSSSHRRRNHDPAFQMTFQFISSIAVVGHYPLRTGKAAVPEDRMLFSSVLPTGYGDAKYICERLLDETLHRDPERFHAMSVRPGQIAGSSKTGFWNTTEHVAFILKSSQTLKALPDFGENSETQARAGLAIRSTTLTTRSGSYGVK